MEAPRSRPAPVPGLPVVRPAGTWRAIAGSFRVAWNGIVETALHQRNMRIHVVAGMLVAVLGSSVALSLAERLAMLLCVFLVLSAEVANSALEALVDLVTRERHELARIAKDAGAGAVLVLAAASVGVLGTVLVRDRSSIFSWATVSRPQVLAGVPLAATAAALLFPVRYSRMAVAGLGVAGIVLLVVVASGTEDVVFTVLAVGLLAVAVAAAARRA